MPKIRARNGSGFIDSPSDIEAGVRSLRRACPIMRRVHDVAGPPPLRRRQGGLPGLARIIVGQQLSTASASAIWARVEARLTPLTAETLLAASDDSLRACGLSSPKIRTLRAVAYAIDQGLDLDGLTALDDTAVHDALCAVKGIGPWTADIYMMFCLGRADAFAAGDLALQIAVAHAAQLAQRPSPAELLAMADRWRPWRGVAARLLWAYYPHMKRGQGTPV